MKLYHLMLKLAHLSGQHAQASHGRKGFSRVSEKVWQGQTDEKGTLDKLQTGSIGEAMVIQALSDHFGVKLATLNVGMNNSPIDVGGPGVAIEVKTGLSSNSESSRIWRANLGEFGKKEKELVSQMSPEEKKQYFTHKSQRILERKNKLLQELSEMSGEEVKGYTAGVILSPDGKKGDVFLVPGFHLSLSWGKYAKDDYYIGSYSAGES